MSLSDHEQQLNQLLDDHFSNAKLRVDEVYAKHFSSPKAVLQRHWQNKRDVPSDLLLIPRSVIKGVFGRFNRSSDSSDGHLSGKEKAVRDIIEHELLDLPSLERTIEQYCNQVIEQYQQSLPQLENMTEQQRQRIREHIDFKLQQLNMPNEGLREALLTLTVMATGKALGDKALFSSAASVGSTVASSMYLSSQSWFGALWAGWFGLPSWVGWAGVGGGIVLVLAVSPLLSPWTELMVNKMRAKRLLHQTVNDAHQRIKQKDGVLLASRLGQYLQFLPDLAQSMAKLL